MRGYLCGDKEIVPIKLAFAAIRDSVIFLASERTWKQRIDKTKNWFPYESEPGKQENKKKAFILWRKNTPQNPYALGASSEIRSWTTHAYVQPHEKCCMVPT